MIIETNSYTNRTMFTVTSDILDATTVIRNTTVRTEKKETILNVLEEAHVDYDVSDIPAEGRNCPVQLKFDLFNHNPEKTLRCFKRGVTIFADAGYNNVRPFRSFRTMEEFWKLFTGGSYHNLSSRDKERIGAIVNFRKYKSMPRIHSIRRVMPNGTIREIICK